MTRKLWIFFFSSFLLTSCSEKFFIQKAAKVPKVPIDDNSTKGLNNFQEDAVYLIQYIQHAYPKLDEEFSKNEFNTISQQLINDLAAVSEPPLFQKKLQYFLAHLQDGHTFVTGIDYLSDKKIFPLILFPLNGKFYLWNVDRSIDSSYLQSEVVNINGFSIDDVKKQIYQLESGENEDWKLEVAKNKFYFPLYWEMLGMANSNKDSLLLTLKTNKGIERISLPSRSGKLTSSGLQKIFYKVPASSFIATKPYYSYLSKEQDYAYFQMNTSMDYIAFKESIKGYVNFPLRPLVLKLARKSLPANFGKSMADFFQKVQASGVNNVILDIRYNKGGEQLLGKQFFYYLSDTAKIRDMHRAFYFSHTYRNTFPELYKQQLKDLKKSNISVNTVDTLINTSAAFKGAHYFDDLLNNNSYYVDPSVKKYNGRIFVLTSAATFSAGNVIATIVKDNQLGTVVGTATGNAPKTQSIYSIIKLPNTKTVVQISTGYVMRPDTTIQTKRLEPDVPVVYTLENYLQKDDPAINAILKVIKSKE